MKKLILLLAIAGFATQTQAQKLKEKDVPSTVTDAFHKAHPAIKHIDWNGSGKNYEATYTDDKVNISSTYDPAGNLTQTETGITTKSLPTPAMNYLKKNYKGSRIKGAAKMTSVDGTVTYEAGIKDMDLIFDSKGNYLRTIKD